MKKITHYIFLLFFLNVACGREDLDYRLGSASKHEDNAASKGFKFNTNGDKWENLRISYSFVPDGTAWSESLPSRLYAKFDPIFPRAIWQGEFRRALATWAKYSPINFYQVPDDGSPGRIPGLPQGDPRFGDIRLGGVDTSNYTGRTWDPGPWTGAGDITLSTTQTFRIGQTVDLYSILLHEIGHALGLEHTVGGIGVMDRQPFKVFSDLSPDDIAGIRAIYGARPEDSYDLPTRNDTITNSKFLTLSPQGYFKTTADITRYGDVDYYKFVASPNPSGPISISVNTRRLSLLAPRLTILNVAHQVIGQSSALSGQDISATIPAPTPGGSYFIKVESSATDVFRIGSYELSITSSGPISPPKAYLLGNNVSGSITVKAGTPVNFTWTSTDGVSARSTYFVDSPDACGYSTTPAPWAAMTMSGNVAGVISACQVGHTYTLTYIVTNSAGQTAQSVLKVIVIQP